MSTTFPLRSRIPIACAGILAGSLLLGLSLLDAWLLVAIPTLAVVALIVSVRPTWALWTGLLLLFFGNASLSGSWEGSSRLHVWGRLLPTVAIGLLTLGFIFKSSLGHGLGKLRGKSLIAAYGAFCAVLVLSGLYNESSIQSLFISFCIYFRYPLFFIILINTDLDLVFYRRMLLAFVFLSLLQIPISLYETHVLGSGVLGSLGHNHGVVAITLLCQCVLLAKWLSGQRRRTVYPILSAALLIPALLGDIMIGVVLFPILIAYLLWKAYGLRRFANSLQSLLRLVFLGTFISLIVLMLYPKVGGYLNVLSNIRTVGGYRPSLDWRDPAVASFASIGRLTIIPLSFPLLLDDPIRLVWGFGPEAAYRGRFADGTTGCVCRELRGMGILCRGSQVFKSLMEFGLLGVFVQAFPFLFLWRSIGKRLRRMKVQQDRLLWLLFETSCFFHIVLAVWYSGAWRLDWYSFPFWLISAAAYSRAYSQEGTVVLGEPRG